RRLRQIRHRPRLRVDLVDGAATVGDNPVAITDGVVGDEWGLPEDVAGVERMSHRLDAPPVRGSGRLPDAHVELLVRADEDDATALGVPEWAHLAIPPVTEPVALVGVDAEHARARRP